MDLDVIEKDGRSIVDMEQNHTLANLIRKAIWANGDEAGYDKGHPLGDESNLIIESEDPERVLKDAIETSRTWMDDLEENL